VGRIAIATTRHCRRPKTDKAYSLTVRRGFKKVGEHPKLGGVNTPYSYDSQINLPTEWFHLRGLARNCPVQEKLADAAGLEAEQGAGARNSAGFAPNFRSRKINLGATALCSLVRSLHRKGVAGLAGGQEGEGRKERPIDSPRHRHRNWRRRPSRGHSLAARSCEGSPRRDHEANRRRNC